MLGKRAMAVGVAGLLVCAGVPARVLADSAEVLPKGVSRAELSGTFYAPITDRFDPDGNRESVDTDFNTTLGANVFPGIIPPDENIGRSVVDFEYKFTDMNFKYQYGLTSRLTVGVEIPYWWSKTDLKEARVDTSEATLGLNPAYGTAPGEPPFLPPSAGGVLNDDAATAFVLGALEQVYGYEPFKSWSESGVSDIKVGARYQYFKSETWRLAFSGGVTLPTGKVDDPDNLLDQDFGRGAWGIFFHANNDYVAVKNLVLNATLKYEVVLPDHQTLRVLYDPNRPIVPKEFEENVDRNLGDIFELSLSGTYDLTEAIAVSLAYDYGKKFKDEVSGDRFESYDALEDETDWTYHLATVGISYSTLPLYAAKKFPVPLTAGIEFENYFAGSNNFLQQTDVSVSLSVFF